MKIVQSFWSYPAFTTDPELADYLLNGGWLHEKYHLMSWALSCLQLRKYYNEVELFTDKIGKELLIDKLGLPYTRVHVIFDELQNYNPLLYAMGKILTYSKQKEPFLHVDGDVFIWKRFSKKMEEASLIAQNVEIGVSFYSALLNSLLDHDFHMPDSIVKIKSLESCPSAYNAGILGGNDIEFFNLYAKEAKRFVDNNLERFGNVNIGLFNTIYEQHLFYCMAREANKKVYCYSAIKDKYKLNTHLKGLNNFKKAPLGKKYIHLFGGDTKKNLQICETLSAKLEIWHPEAFRRVLEKVSERTIQDTST